MADLIVGAVLIISVGAAISYLVRAKKRGVKCVGCPEGGTCAARNNPGSCGCSAALEAAEAEVKNEIRNCR